MKCNDTKSGDAVVVDVVGKLVGGPGSEAFHGLIKTLLERGERRIVVNLQETPWANSQGIGLLIGALTSVTREGGRLVLANGCERIRDVLKVTRLTMIFDCYDSIEAAVRGVSLDGGGSAAHVGVTRNVDLI